tara:strand:+ start:455 stop:826 length:372 start_codon:yes stop_codon:yes gene_type:complete
MAFKMSGHELSGPNQRKKSPMKIGFTVGLSMLGKGGSTKKDKNEGEFSKTLNRATRTDLGERTSHPKKGLSKYDPKTNDYTKSSMKEPGVKRVVSTDKDGTVIGNQKKTFKGVDKAQWMKSKK